MTNFKYNRLLIVFIIIGLITAIAVNIQRYNIEKANMTVDMAIDYEDMIKLSQLEGVPLDTVLAKAKSAGISSLAVYETTFEKLNENGKVMAIAGSSIIQNYYSGALTDPNWRQLVQNGTIKADDVYVVGHDKQTYKEVKEDLFRRLGIDRVNAIDVNGQEILSVKANYTDLLKMNLGMPTDEMKAVNDAGFYVLARPSNYKNVSNEDIDAVFDRLKNFKVSEIVFSGSEALGGNEHTKRTIKHMKEQDITLGMIENVTQLQFYPQDGLLDIARGLNYDAARLYTIPKDEQPKLKMDVAVERWANTDEERNIRIDLLRIYEKPEGDMSLLDTNLKYISDTRDKLESKGFSIGPASHFESFFGNKYLQAIMIFGVCSATVLYISLVCPAMTNRKQYILLLILSILTILPVLIGKGAMARSVVALAAANIFPAIAMISQLDVIRRNRLIGKLKYTALLIKAVKALVCASVISMAGAMFLSGILSDVEYFLEMSIFRGIKLTFVLPIILVAIAFLKRFDIFGKEIVTPPAFKTQLKRILNITVTVKSLIGFFAVLVVAIIFIGRSGHTAGIPVPGIELKIRAFLEQAFYARPRSKEIFIGHPAFVIMLMAWYRKWPSGIFFVLSILATIGQGSMVETFAHMRTPMFMSLMRGFDGALWGLIIGCIIMGALYLWQYIASSTDRSKSLNE